MNKIFLLTSILIGLTISSLFAQQPWRFHIAFEDGTGQRDTIWMVFDNSATVEGVDYQLGEGTPEYNPNAFNVFMYNMESDSTKIIAYPYSMCPYMFTGSIYSINYTYPIVIRWDTSLFHAQCLPINPALNIAIIIGNYPFFMLPIYPTAPYLHTINMLTKDSIFCPEDFNGVQFPLFGDQSLGFAVDHDNYLYLAENKIEGIFLYPNPANEYLIVSMENPIISYRITDITGNIVISEYFNSYRKMEAYKINCHDLCTGLYLMESTNYKNQKHYEKFVIKK